MSTHSFPQLHWAQLIRGGIEMIAQSFSWHHCFYAAFWWRFLTWLKPPILFFFVFSTLALLISSHLWRKTIPLQCTWSLLGNCCYSDMLWHKETPWLWTRGMRKLSCWFLVGIGWRQLLTMAPCKVSDHVRVEKAWTHASHCCPWRNIATEQLCCSPWAEVHFLWLSCPSMPSHMLSFPAVIPKTTHFRHYLSLSAHPSLICAEQQKNTRFDSNPYGS